MSLYVIQSASVIQASGIALCAGAVPRRLMLPVSNNRYLFPLLKSRQGQPLFMTLQRAHWSFTPGTRTRLYGANGRYLGPTIRDGR